MIYLDNSATTPVAPYAAQAVLQAMAEGFFNPSALYAPALEAEKKMQQARKCILSAVSAPLDAQVVFTSGGTEADNLAILGGCASLREGRVLYTAGEHPAVREAALSLKNVKAEEIPLLHDGRVDLEKLEAMLAPDVRMICVMHVNNETGAVMQLKEIARLRDALAKDALLHIDGVQGFLRVPFNMADIGADSYALSGHKIHAPKGVGALVMGKRLRPAARQIGGGQERALRSGTENTPGIAGLYASIEHFPRTDIRAVKLALYDALCALIPQVHFNGPDPRDEQSAPHILNLSLPPVRSETMLHALEGENIYIGLGSACSSQKQKVSRVLRAMNTPPGFAISALRFSLSPYNTVEEMQTVAQKIHQHYSLLKRFVRR